MYPVIMNLSRWQPFGLPLSSFPWNILATVALLTICWLLLGGAQRWGKWRLAAYVLAGLTALGGAACLAATVGKVHSYGLMLALGVLTGIAVARWRAKRCGEDPDTVSTLGILALVGGVIGARVSFVIEHWDEYAGKDLIEMGKLTSGGLVFDGGLFLAIVLVGGYLWLRKLPVRRLLDIIAISAMIGLAFGRMGCLLNGCCYGGVCSESFPLAVHFPYAASPPIYPHDTANPFPPKTDHSAVYSVHAGRYSDPKHQPYLAVPPELMGPRGLIRPGDLTTARQFEVAHHSHSLAVEPSQIYGIANALILAALMTAVFRLRTRDGQAFAMLFVFYPLTRFMLEIIRDDNPNMTLTPAQWKCLVMAGIGAALMVALRRLPASSGPALAGRLAAREVSHRSAKSGNRRKRR